MSPALSSHTFFWAQEMPEGIIVIDLCLLSFFPFFLSPQTSGLFQAHHARQWTPEAQRQPSFLLLALPGLPAICTPAMLPPSLCVSLLCPPQDQPAMEALAAPHRPSCVKGAPHPPPQPSPDSFQTLFPNRVVWLADDSPLQGHSLSRPLVEHELAVRCLAEGYVSRRALHRCLVLPPGSRKKATGSDPWVTIDPRCSGLPWGAGSREAARTRSPIVCCPGSTCLFIRILE